AGSSLASAVFPETPEPAQDGGPADLELGEKNLRSYLADIERRILERALASARGNQSEAARRLGVSRSAFVDRLKKFEIPT
ncbi:MAG TPA: helix-turn-helix domain-containing protein, partial [Anaeromyxobacteraceae bacterium]|nr:helix-turn-helix domain-containing protein [Anaeromyxobacteraceae bacterium]